MNQRFIISSCTFLLAIVVDQLAKIWAMSLPTLYFNQGFIMGLYSELPDNIRIVAVGSFAGIVFFLYVFLLLIIPARAKVLTYGLSLIVGGMFGNVIDRIILGKTIDFIPFNLFGIHTVFNLADIFLWAGSLMVIYILLRKEKLIWFPDSSRGSFLIWPREQYKTGFHFSLIVLCCSLALGFFSYSFFNTSVPPWQIGKEKFLLTYSVTYTLITLFFCTMAFVTGVIFSHRNVGPLHAFELYVDDLINGQDRKLNFREGDNYKQLESVAERLRNFINKNKS